MTAVGPDDGLGFERGTEMSIIRSLRLRVAAPLLVAAVAAFGYSMVAGSSASAAGGAEVTREIVVDDLEVEHTTNNCSGVEGTFSRTFHGFIQTVTRPGGTTLFRGWLRADDATFVPDDPAEPTFTGRELIHVSMVGNGATATTTFSLHFRASAADGTTAAFEEVEHVTISAGGEVEFEKPVVIC
jgi:hypothetical protein